MNKLYWLVGTVCKDGVYTKIEIERVAVNETEALLLVKKTFPDFKRSAWGVKKYLT